MPTKLLLVEDDAALAGLIADYLRQNGFLVDIESRGDLAAATIHATPPDLVILDLMLPGMDGFAVCRSVRERYAGAILMLTARDDPIDQILGLELGADDYLTKPVDPRLLLARVRMLLRRVSPPAVAADPAPAGCDVLRFGELECNRRSRQVLLAGAPLPLSTAEFDLLWLLASRAGEVIGRESLLESLRDLGFDGEDRSLDARVSRLRKKLDERGDLDRIKTVRSQGYLFRPGDSA